MRQQLSWKVKKLWRQETIQNNFFYREIFTKSWSEKENVVVWWSKEVLQIRFCSGKEKVKETLQQEEIKQWHCSSSGERNQWKTFRCWRWDHWWWWSLQSLFLVQLLNISKSTTFLVNSSNVLLLLIVYSRLSYFNIIIFRPINLYQ